MQREGFGIRLGAALLDAVILFAVGAILGLAMGGSMWAIMAGGGNNPSAQAGAQAVGIGFIILILVVTVGYTLTEVFMAGTPGKRVLGIMIADENGRPATTAQLTQRWLIKSSGNLIRMIGSIIGVGAIVTIGGLVGLVIFVGCFFVLGAARQAFHDKAAKTAVFKRAHVLTTSGPQGFQVMPPAAGGYAPPPPPPQA